MNRFRLALFAVLAAALPAGAADWPQWMGPNRDSVWPEEGILSKFPEGGPKVLWRVPIAGGYAGPAVVGDKVFVHDYEKAEGNDKANPLVRNELKGKERVLCLDAKTGKEIWKHEYDCPYKVSYPAGPRCTPTVHDGKVYTLGAMGHLFCLNAEDGSVIWSKDFTEGYRAPVPQWGFCGHPLVHGDKLICIVGGKGSVAVAFNKDTGEELWKALTAREPGYCPPTPIEAGGVDQVVIWHAESVNGLDPENGDVYWSAELEPSYGMAIAAPVKEGPYLFVTGYATAALCLKLAEDKPAVEEIWRGDKRNGVYCCNATPWVEGDYIYGCESSNGALRCVELKTGEVVWEDHKPTTGGERAIDATAFLVKNGDRFFIFAETGHLIIGKLSPEGYEEIDRAKLLEPTGEAFNRPVLWSHPAFANQCCYARNDKEIICVSLAE